MPRKKLPIDPEQVRKLAMIDCSLEEMASIIGCNESTLTQRFSEEIKLGRANGCASLKRTQYNKAVNHENVPLLIWLGKTRLKQREVTVQYLIDPISTDKEADEKNLSEFETMSSDKTCQKK